MSPSWRICVQRSSRYIEIEGGKFQTIPHYLDPSQVSLQNLACVAFFFILDQCFHKEFFFFFIVKANVNRADLEIVADNTINIYKAWVKPQRKIKKVQSSTTTFIQKLHLYLNNAVCRYLCCLCHLFNLPVTVSSFLQSPVGSLARHPSPMYSIKNRFY